MNDPSPLGGISLAIFFFFLRMEHLRLEQSEELLKNPGSAVSGTGKGEHCPQPFSLGATSPSCRLPLAYSRCSRCAIAQRKGWDIPV